MDYCCGNKSNAFAIFHVISVFVAEQSSTLSGNSLEEPLGELATPFFSKLQHCANTEERTAHTLTHAGMVVETTRETKEGNKRGVMLLNGEDNAIKQNG